MDKKIFITGEKDGVIYIYDDNGEKIHVIEHKFEKIKVMEKDKKRYYHFFKTSPGTRQQYEVFKHLIKFPSHFPSIRGMDVVDGNVYVNGYLRND